MRKYKIYVESGDEYDIAWLDGAELSTEEEADVILFTGGSDVNPTLYGENVGKHTSYDEDRDNACKALYERNRGKIMLGICRGSQWLAIMAGGKLIQDIKHPGTHVLYTEGKNYMVNSTHHQLMYPFNVEHELIGWAQKSPFHLDGNDQQVKMPILNGKAVEPEVVWFPKINALCIQSHPEYKGYPAARLVPAA